MVMGVFDPKRERDTWININAVPQFMPGEDKPYQVYTMFEDITERVHAEAAVLQRTQELEALASVSAALRRAKSKEELIPLILKQAVKVISADGGVLFLLHRGVLYPSAAHGIDGSLVQEYFLPDNDPVWEVMRIGDILHYDDTSRITSMESWTVSQSLLENRGSGMILPLKTTEGMVWAPVPAVRCPKTVL